MDKIKILLKVIFKISKWCLIFVALLLFLFVCFILPYRMKPYIPIGDMALAFFGVDSSIDFVVTMYELENIVSGGLYEKELQYWKNRLEE